MGSQTKRLPAIAHDTSVRPVSGAANGRRRETHRHERILGKMVAFRRAIAACVPAVCVIRVITHIVMPCLAVTIITACL